MAEPPACSVGCDVEDVERWRRPRRLADLFTPDELAWAASRPDPAQTHAGLWCAREAAWKALSPHVPGIGLRDLAVAHDEEGRPLLVVLAPAHAAWADRVSLSISHTPTTALAVAIVS